MRRAMARKEKMNKETNVMCYKRKREGGRKTQGKKENINDVLLMLPTYVPTTKREHQYLVRWDVMMNGKPKRSKRKRKEM